MEQNVRLLKMFLTEDEVCGTSSLFNTKTVGIKTQ